MSTANPSFGFTSGMTEKSAPLPIKMGLNTGLTLSKFQVEYTQEKPSQPSQPFLQIEFTVEGMDNPISFRLYELTLVKYYDRDTKAMAETTDFNHIEFKKAAEERRRYVNHLMANILSADQAQGEQMLAQSFNNLPSPITNYEQMCRFMVSVLPQNLQAIKFDVFLDYPWKISSGKDRTYLGIAQYTEHGFFIRRTKVGVEYKEQRMPEIPAKGQDSVIALRYVSDSGETHFFVRDVAFMRSVRATGQNKKDKNAALTASVTPPVSSPPVNPPNGNSTGEQFF